MESSFQNSTSAKTRTTLDITIMKSHSLSRIAIVSLAALLCLTQSSCVVLLSHAMDVGYHAIATRFVKYPDAKSALPALKGNEGRVVVYWPENNWTPETVLLGGVSDEIMFSVNRNVYPVMRNTFWVTNVAAGSIEFTTGGVVQGFPPTAHKGKHSIRFSLSAGQTVFVRVSRVEGSGVSGGSGILGSSGLPGQLEEVARKVSRSVAEKELANVNYYSNMGITKPRLVITPQ